LCATSCLGRSAEECAEFAVSLPGSGGHCKLSALDGSETATLVLDTSAGAFDPTEKGADEGADENGDHREDATFPMLVYTIEHHVVRPPKCMLRYRLLDPCWMVR
jgi:hypothetical protein